MTTAAARWNRLDSEVPLADDLHFSRRGFDLVGALTHHRVEQFPAVVGAQLEQALVNCGNRDCTAGRRRLAVEGPHRDLDERLVANVVDGFLGRDLYVQAMVSPSHANSCDAQLERRLPEIDH